MTPPREADTGRGQAGGLAQSLPGKTASGAACFFLSLKTPQKPLEPLFYSDASTQNRAQTGKTVENGAGGLSRNAAPQNPPITSVPTPTHSGTAEGSEQKTAPSAGKPAPVSSGGGESSPGGFRGAAFSTPTPFTPSPPVEYQTLCEYHASLTAYIEREAPELRATGDGDALSELERLASAMLDRISELEAQGAHLGSAGGAG